VVLVKKGSKKKKKSLETNDEDTNETLKFPANKTPHL
jgi:hypothetical protein